MKSDIRFLVRILCMTYNHETYISDAMTGFVMQKTDFPFVVVIIDDASTDKTGEVIRQFVTDHFSLNKPMVGRMEEKEYGQLIFAQHKVNKNCYFAVILLNENHFKSNKDKRGYYREWLNTKYVALCEGDDYWTDSSKLQKQVDYMDSNPDCMLSVHSANWRSGDCVYPWGCQDSCPKDYSVDELIRCGGLFFATASYFYKSEIAFNWPDWRRKAEVDDFPIQILSGLLGRVHYLPDRMCVYRYLGEGSWTSKNIGKLSINYQKNKIEWMTLLDEATDHLYQKEIYNQLFQPYNILFNYHEIGFGEYAKAVHKAGQKRYGRLMKDFLRFYLTPVYRFLNSFRKK